MVKGVSRQVIVVHPQEAKLFDQAIFILREEALREGVTDEVLMQEADRLLRSSGKKKTSRGAAQMLWAGMGGAAVGLVWLLTILL